MAWLTTLMGVRCRVAASTSAQARYVTYLAARAAGYPVEYKDARASRLPEWDAWAAMTERPSLTSVPETGA